jgi:hypothetical protein
MCNKMGGKLVEIETAAENAVLRPIVDSMNRMSFYSVYLCIFILNFVMYIA